MKTIIGGRQTGKTTELIKMAAENNKYILVSDRPRAMFLAKMAKDMGLHIPFPITLPEIAHPVRGTYIKDIYVDEAITVLTDLIYRNTGFVISAVTISSDDIMFLDPEKKHE